MPEPTITIPIEVERVLYPAETVEGARWFILSCRDEKGVEIICKGDMPWRPRPKEPLRLTGEYTVYQGKRQFKFKEAMLNMPTDSRGLLRYVCELAKGVGPALEALIWEARGDTWAAIQDGEIPRLSGKVYHSLMEALEVAEADRKKSATIAELMRAGCSVKMATAAFEQWSGNALGVVVSDPYRLAELPNYGFSDVDGDIRLFYGISDDDPRRIRAAVVYVLRQITGSGSTVVRWEHLHAACIEKLGGFAKLIVEQVRLMFGEGTLRGFEKSRNVSLAKDYKNELTIWEFLNNG
jgi:exodeoxyribonuclease V alpha subunit